MFAYIVRRLISSSITIVLLSFTVFAFMTALPGNACTLKEKPGDPTNCEEVCHLNWDFGWQYTSYLVGDDTVGEMCHNVSFLPACEPVRNASHYHLTKGLIRGDLGTSCP